MKIFLDARVLSVQRGGVAKIVLELLEVLSTRQDVKVVCYAMKNGEAITFSHPNVEFKFLSWPFGVKKMTRFLVENTTLWKAVWKEAPDIAIFPNYTMPLLPLPRQTKVVVGIWDISYSTHPSHYTFMERLSLHGPSKYAARVADLVVTCSEFDGEQISKYYHINRQKIHLLELNADDRFFGEIGTSVKSHTTENYCSYLSDMNVQGPYILSLGVIYQRRLVPEIITAFVNLKKSRKLPPDLQLLVIGKNLIRPKFNLQGLISECHEFGIRYGDFVPSKDLVSVYRNALCYVCLSEVDGEAVLVKEAAALEVPIITTPMLSGSVGGHAVEIGVPVTVGGIESGLQEFFDEEDLDTQVQDARRHLETINVAGSYNLLVEKILNKQGELKNA
jgi:glycosyltransferase involved in cell wall biosynthesis